MRDLFREAIVEEEHANAALRLQTATTPEARRKALDDLRYWKSQRSPEKVREIEEQKGIAPCSHS